MMFYKETDLKKHRLVKSQRIGRLLDLDENVAKIIMGQSPPFSTYSKEKNGLPFLQGKMEFGRLYPSTSVYCSGPIKIAEPNDVLFSVRAPVGDVNLAPYRLCIGRGLAAIRFNDKVANSLFYFYYFQKVKKRLEALGKGSTFKAVNKDDLENLLVALPSLSEQRAVVGVLGVVDSAIELVDKIIAKTERLKKGLMQMLLTRGIGHTEYKQTPIGTIPKTWQIVRIEDIAETSSGGTPSRSKKEYFEGNIPWVKSGELKDKVIYDTEEKITTEGLQNSAAKIFPKGTLLIAMYGATVGKTGILGLNAATNQAICAILPKDDTFDVRFLRYYIVFRREQMIAISAGGAQPNISQEIIRSTRIALPPLPEQQRIAEILSVVDRELELEREEKTRLERIKRGLMDLLLTGKIRVKVD